MSLSRLPYIDDTVSVRRSRNNTSDRAGINCISRAEIAGRSPHPPPLFPHSNRPKLRPLAVNPCHDDSQMYRDIVCMYKYRVVWRP